MSYQISVKVIWTGPDGVDREVLLSLEEFLIELEKVKKAGDL